MELANPMDYLASLNYGSEFVKAVSDNTGKQYLELWKENARANKELIKRCGWVATDLQDAHKGKTAVMLGASPAIVKQLETLRELQEDPDFVFVTVHSGLKLLLENGITPKYCMLAEADPDAKRLWKDMDTEKTKKIMLLPNICSHPDLLAGWKGPMKFVAYYSSDKDFDRKCKKWFRPINGVDHYFYSLSSQYNAGTAISILVFGCNPIVFVGNECSFETEKSTYYPDRKDVKDNFERKPHLDIYGNIVRTSYGLYSLKIGLEDFLGKLSGVGWFFNCTEAGIFGVSVKHGNLSWIHQLKLRHGIAQARSLMRTGKPLYV